MPLHFISHCKDLNICMLLPSHESHNPSSPCIDLARIWQSCQHKLHPDLAHAMRAWYMHSNFHIKVLHCRSSFQVRMSASSLAYTISYLQMSYFCHICYIMMVQERTIKTHLFHSIDYTKTHYCPYIHQNLTLEVGLRNLAASAQLGCCAFLYTVDYCAITPGKRFHDMNMRHRLDPFAFMNSTDA